MGNLTPQSICLGFSGNFGQQQQFQSGAFGGFQPGPSSFGGPQQAQFPSPGLQGTFGQQQSQQLGAQQTFGQQGKPTHQNFGQQQGGLTSFGGQQQQFGGNPASLGGQGNGQTNPFASLFGGSSEASQFSGFPNQFGQQFPSFGQGAQKPEQPQAGQASQIQPGQFPTAQGWPAGFGGQGQIPQAGANPHLQGQQPFNPQGTNGQAFPGQSAQLGGNFGGNPGGFSNPFAKPGSAPQPGNAPQATGQNGFPQAQQQLFGQFNSQLNQQLLAATQQLGGQSSPQSNAGVQGSVGVPTAAEKPVPSAFSQPPQLSGEPFYLNRIIFNRKII